MIHGGHQDQVPAGKGDVGGDPGALEPIGSRMI